MTWVAEIVGKLSPGQIYTKLQLIANQLKRGGEFLTFLDFRACPGFAELVLDPPPPPCEDTVVEPVLRWALQTGTSVCFMQTFGRASDERFRKHRSCDRAKHKQASLPRLNVFRTQDSDTCASTGSLIEEATRTLEAFEWWCEGFVLRQGVSI